MSQDVFQMRMDHIIDRLSGILKIHGVICVLGCIPREHDRCLIQLIQVATKNGLVFNSKKCRIILTKIGFYGAVFTSKGMEADP